MADLLSLNRKIIINTGTKTELDDAGWPKTYSMYATIPGNTGKFIGVDPGVNFGLTAIEDEKMVIYWGALPPNKEKGRHGIDAFNFVIDIIPRWIAGCVVEGAAYNSKFGQVGLEEVRFGFFFALYRQCWDVHIVAPAAVRKLAFGNGKIPAFDVWPDINHNAADSIGCALAAIAMKGEK